MPINNGTEERQRPGKAGLPKTAKKLVLLRSSVIGSTRSLPLLGSVTERRRILTSEIHQYQIRWVSSNEKSTGMRLDRDSLTQRRRTPARQRKTAEAITVPLK